LNRKKEKLNKESDSSEKSNSETSDEESDESSDEEKGSDEEEGSYYLLDKKKKMKKFKTISTNDWKIVKNILKKDSRNQIRKRKNSYNKYKNH
jgi:hypothetical protein